MKVPAGLFQEVQHQVALQPPSKCDMIALWKAFAYKVHGINYKAYSII